MKMNRKNIFILFKNIIFGIFLAFCSLLISLLICGFIFYQKLNAIYQTFLNEAQVSDLELRQTLETSINQSQNVKKNLFFLIMGVDSMQNRTSPPLTDTIIIANLNLENKKINLLSLPRDLYLKEYQTKINALYYYSKERNEPQFATQIISELIKKEIDYTLVLELDQVKNLINLINGLNLEIKHGFVDEKFPREDVNFDTEKNPDNWYKTIEFKTGWQTLNGTQALEYIRSRYSGDEEGNDISRNQRQQDIIKALPNNLLKKIYQPQNNPNFINVELLGKLWKFYQDNFNEDLPITDLLALVINQIQNEQLNINFQFNQFHLASYPDDENGVIVNPPVAKYQQWVYEIKNQKQFDNFIIECFN